MATLPSGLSDHIDEEEELARFLIQSNHFNSTMAKPAAFLPSPSDRETSVSRHNGTPREELWELGLVAAAERMLYGAAVVRAGVIREIPLDLLADEPPPRHAVIRGWPQNDADPVMQKAKQKEMATVIASQSRLVLR